jgi:hypothetical protein
MTNKRREPAKPEAGELSEAELETVDGGVDLGKPVSGQNLYFEDSVRTAREKGSG